MPPATIPDPPAAGARHEDRLAPVRRFSRFWSGLLHRELPASGFTLSQPAERRTGPGGSPLHQGRRAGPAAVAHGQGLARGWSARRGGMNLGCVFVVQAPPAAHGEGVARLRMLLAEPQARGLRLGQRLVDESLGSARSAGLRKATPWTNFLLQTGQTWELWRDEAEVAR